MELMLHRTYFSHGTQGRLTCKGIRLCDTIEQPWRHNAATTSCIPEGRYILARRYSPQHGHHLEVTNVADRSLILMHPACDALHKLNGCIATVTALNGEEQGSNSKKAFALLMELVQQVDPGEAIVLNIKTKLYEYR